MSISDCEKQVISGIKDMMMRNSSNVKVTPLLSRSTKEIYHIMLPEKRKIIHRMYVHVKK
ncbi:hypothetical protein GGR08_000685 [Bartonella fuyuanensis]|uniref:Uncharacterized protein n=1 Tax=Bartonella fuyuanensis TaxID=1460968 RepID=A0A840E2H3_9HYPH|nr:hypothetical protein [Bartonella fuyuanensis]